MDRKRWRPHGTEPGGSRHPQAPEKSCDRGRCGTMMPRVPGLTEVKLICCARRTIQFAGEWEHGTGEFWGMDRGLGMGTAADHGDGGVSCVRAGADSQKCRRSAGEDGEHGDCDWGNGAVGDWAARGRGVRLGGCVPDYRSLDADEGGDFVFVKCDDELRAREHGAGARVEIAGSAGGFEWVDSVWLDHRVFVHRAAEGMATDRWMSGQGQRGICHCAKGEASKMRTQTQQDVV